MVGVATVLCLGAAATASAHAQAGSTVERSGGDRAAAGAIDDARHAYEEGRWEAAFRAFAALADLGDAEAARIAWLMHRHGPALYRSALPVSDAQRLHWQQISATVVPLPFRSESKLAWKATVDADPSRPPAHAGTDQPRR